MEFAKAIVRRPCKNMVFGLTTANLGTPDFNLALKQHDAYISALEKCGLKVKVLESDERYPDSVFIEDVALLTPKVAIITNPGAASRLGEVERIENTLVQFYQHIEKITTPGTIEAGDIMMVENHFYIGLSERTNIGGAKQMITILTENGMTGSTVKLEKVLHLKTGVSYLDDNKLLVAGEFTNKEEFVGYDKIVLREDESYAANSVWINGNVLVPEGFPDTAEKIKKVGYNVIKVNVSEFQKLDGGLSCLSLRF